MTSNAALASVVLDETLAWGVRDFVVCTGARNAPLVLPLLNAPETIKLWRHFEERAAGFFALGLAKRDRRPVAVVTTSGTAVAELMPAVIEAHYSGIPLVLITADRPKRFRATGAPQAIEQAHLFGAYSEGCFDVEAAEDFPVGFPWNRSRPIQLNPCFEEPNAEDVAEVNWDEAVSRGEEPFEAPVQPSSFPDPTLLGRFVSDFEGGAVLLGEIRRTIAMRWPVFLKSSPRRSGRRRPVACGSWKRWRRFFSRAAMRPSASGARKRCCVSAASPACDSGGTWRKLPAFPCFR